ncbi:hypothetical protein RHGRI_005623 [Rhododendron griersonianum]|uniref:F-box domain-containing protein n=1 Tax=Rhododendron griersonianum TaxID=479676 RepID=A0AAV6LFK5_9ERIC|nr:hypothetical protein RHGRI_005623 [Rhododendron griersonianum]
MEASVICESNVVSLGDDMGTHIDSISLGDEVITSKQSTNILDLEGLRRKGRPPCKRKQGFVEIAVKKKRETKKKTLSNEKVKEVEKIAVGHGFGTQESVVNGHPSYMGHSMWPNMMPHNMQANMTQGETIFPFSPTLCPTRTSLNQFRPSFPSSQSFFNGQVWRVFEIERVPSLAYGGRGGRDLRERSKSILAIVVRSSSAYGGGRRSGGEASSSLVSSAVVLVGGLGWGTPQNDVVLGVLGRVVDDVVDPVVMSPESVPLAMPPNNECGEQEEVWSRDIEHEEEVWSGPSSKDCDVIETTKDGKEEIENCEDKVEEPKEGMAFDTPEDAYRYYLRYAQEKGFAIAKRSSRKGSDGKLRHIGFECCRAGKAREVEKIAVGHGFGTQESVVNGHPSYMGHSMWPNMMPHNMQANMTQGETIFPFSPTLCPTRTSLNQFRPSFPSSQSFFNGQVWRVFEIERVPSLAYGGRGGRDLRERSKSILAIVVRSSSAYGGGRRSGGEASSSLVSSGVVLVGGLGWGTPQNDVVLGRVVDDVVDPVVYVAFLFRIRVDGEDNMRGTKRKAAPNTAAVSVASISDVPNPIVCDILSRLPLNSIFTCKRVSKAWRDLILDPHFERLHLSRSPLSLFFFRNGDINNIYNSNSASSHFEIFQLHDPPVLEHYNATMKFKTEVYFSGMHIAASCNGLILLSNWSDGRVIVCNPLRAQHFILPKTVTDTRSLRFMFGHSPATDQYKVLRCYYLMHSPSILGFDIYTIGIDDKWRSTGYPGQPRVGLESQLVFLNGAFHWIGFENNSRFICYFDIEKERFGSFPLPSHIGIAFLYLGVVDNWLYICSLDAQKVWVMKDYGDFSSWTLEWVIDGARLGTAMPLKMLKDGTLLIMFNKWFNISSVKSSIKITLASYNPQTRVLKKIKHFGNSLWGASVADVPRFFSPMDALKLQC